MAPHKIVNGKCVKLSFAKLCIADEPQRAAALPRLQVSLCPLPEDREVARWGKGRRRQRVRQKVYTDIFCRSSPEDLEVLEKKLLEIEEQLIGLYGLYIGDWCERDVMSSDNTSAKSYGIENGDRDGDPEVCTSRANDVKGGKNRSSAVTKNIGNDETVEKMRGDSEDVAWRSFTDMDMERVDVENEIEKDSSFTLTIPHLPELKMINEQEVDDVDQWLFNHFNATLSLAVDEQDKYISGEDLEQTQNTLKMSEEIKEGRNTTEIQENDVYKALAPISNDWELNRSNDEKEVPVQEANITEQAAMNVAGINNNNNVLPATNVDVFSVVYFEKPVSEDKRVNNLKLDHVESLAKPKHHHVDAGILSLTNQISNGPTRNENLYSNFGRSGAFIKTKSSAIIGEVSKVSLESHTDVRVPLLETKSVPLKCRVNDCQVQIRDGERFEHLAEGDIIVNGLNDLKWEVENTKPKPSLRRRSAPCLTVSTSPVSSRTRRKSGSVSEDAPGKYYESPEKKGQRRRVGRGEVRSCQAVRFKSRLGSNDLTN